MYYHFANPAATKLVQALPHPFAHMPLTSHSWVLSFQAPEGSPPQKSKECGGAGAIVEEEAPATQQEVAAEGVLEGSQGLQPSAKGATKEGLGSGENRAPRPPTCFRIGVPLDNYTY